jgi:hypothetical protein
VVCKSCVTGIALSGECPYYLLNLDFLFLLPGQIRDDNGDGEEAGPQA